MSPPGGTLGAQNGCATALPGRKGGSCRAQHSQSHVSGRRGDSTAGRWLPQVSISHTCCQLLIGGLAVVGAGSQGGLSQLVAVACESAESWHMSTLPGWYLGRSAAMAVVARHCLFQASSWLSRFPYARFLYLHSLGGTVLAF